MDDATIKLIVFLISYVLGGLVLGIMAARKNRDYMSWALLGGLFWFTCILAVAFLPPLCPKCKRPLMTREWRRRVCPTCGPVGTPAQATEDAYALLAKATKLEVKGCV